jgi:hypothetical protein
LAGGMIVKKAFSEVKLFQVKPDKLDEFEKLIVVVAEEQRCKKAVLILNI